MAVRSLVDGGGIRSQDLEKRRLFPQLDERRGDACASVAWPSRSTKKRYSHRPVRAGRDSSRDMLTAVRGRSVRAVRRRRPGRFGADITSEVSSLPDGGDRLPAEHPEARRVVGLVLDVRREHRQAVDRGGDLAGDRRGARLGRRRAAPPRHCSPPRCAARPAGAWRATARTAPATARANRPWSPRPSAAGVGQQVLASRAA